jgi:uncharacterized coiled-coil DUF342 family protein
MNPLTEQRTQLTRTSAVNLHEENTWLRQALAAVRAQRDQLEQEQSRRMHTLAEQKRELARLAQQAAALRAHRQGPQAQVIAASEERISALAAQVEQGERVAAALALQVTRQQAALLEVERLLRHSTLPQVSPLRRAQALLREVLADALEGCGDG